MTETLLAPRALLAAIAVVVGSVLVSTSARADDTWQIGPGAEPAAAILPQPAAPALALAPPAAPPAADPAPMQAAAGDEFADADPSALTDFQQPLAGHGQWVTDPSYGTLWVPDKEAVGADFAPYQTAGHWALDDQSRWMWVSDYPWGYIPFHYGRWTWVPGTGWGWIPGRTYSPAWVSWRVGSGGYIGWGPMAPAYAWRGGVPVAFGVRPMVAYGFVPTAYAFSPRVGGYVVRSPANVRIAVGSTRVYTGVGVHGYASPGIGHAYVPAGSVVHAHADFRSAAYSTRSGTASFRSASPAAGATYHAHASASASAYASARTTNAASMRGTRTASARASTSAGATRSGRTTAAIHTPARAESSSTRSRRPAASSSSSHAAGGAHHR